MALDHEKLELRCRVEFSWWVHVYLDILEFFCNLMGQEPDYDKAAAIMVKGAKIVIEEIEPVKNTDSEESN